MTTISVLMSVYKSDLPISFDRAIQSIWTDQTLQPDEIILIEDGPLTNDLYKVIKKWQSVIGDKLKILKNEQNIGLTKSLNKGLKVASGDYIARMDSDDISLPDRFKLQTQYMDSNPLIMASSGSVEIFDDKGNYLYTKRFPLTNSEAKKRISRSSPLSHPCSIIRSEIFKKGISYNEEYRTSQDIALWFDILSNGYQVGNINDSILQFTYDNDLFKRRSINKARKELKIYMKGIKKLYGPITWRFLYPLLRYLFRMLPLPIIKIIYNSKLKNTFS